MKTKDRWKQMGFILLFACGLWGAGHPGIFTILNGANLLFHEGGHVVFGMAGHPLLGVLGGTLGQLAFPFALTAIFLKQGKIASAMVMLWWLGQNFTNIAPYIGDANTQVLNLVGDGTHDWNFLLRYFQVLAYDRQIGGAVWFCGLMLMLGAAITGFVFADTGGGPALGLREAKRSYKVLKPYKDRDKRDPFL